MRNSDFKWQSKLPGSSRLAWKPKTVKSARSVVSISLRPPPGTSLPFSTHLSMTIFTHPRLFYLISPILPISETKKFLSLYICACTNPFGELLPSARNCWLCPICCSLSRVTVCVSILCNLPSIRWWRAINTIPQRQASRDSFKTKLVELYCTTYWLMLTVHVQADVVSTFFNKIL